MYPDGNGVLFVHFFHVPFALWSISVWVQVIDSFTTEYLCIFFFFFISDLDIAFHLHFIQKRNQIGSESMQEQTGCVCKVFFCLFFRFFFLYMRCVCKHLSGFSYCFVGYSNVFHVIYCPKYFFIFKDPIYEYFRSMELKPNHEI